MPKGTCDHTLDPNGFNTLRLTKANGDVMLEVRWEWDGVSVWPECDGPVIRARASNTGTQTWYAHVPRARGGTRTIEIAPGDVKTWTGAQLATVGLDTLTALTDFTLNTSPTARQQQ